MDMNSMKRGDVLLLQDGSSCSTHMAITTGQALFTHSIAASSSSNITHAGVYDGGGKILEASGAKGLRMDSLVTKHKGSKYQVFRYQNKEMASKAAWWAEHFVYQRLIDPNSNNGNDKGSGFGRYDMNGLGGLFHNSNKNKGAKKAVKNLLADPHKDRGFYCSNFVCEVYELASDGKSPINVDYNQVSPKRLQGELRKGNGWTKQGEYTV